MFKYFGTFVNAGGIVLGGLIGLLLRRRRREGAGELNDQIMFCLGLCTLFAAAPGLLGVQTGLQALIVVASAVLGLLTGYALRIEDRIASLGERVSKSGAQGSSGLLTATLLFCIGSMAVLGSFEGAMNPPDALDLNCHTTLLIKTMLDFVSAIFFTMSSGAIVMLSAVAVMLFQGLLTLLSSVVQPFLMELNVLPVIYCVGSLVLIAIALNLMKIKKTKTADYLPALFLPVLLAWLLKLVGVGL